MTILHLSDTHNHHQQLVNLPAADVIIHSGDLSKHGTDQEVADFIEWFGSLNYAYKIFIAGNHDYCLDGKDRETIQSFLPDNCFYLFNSGITIAGVKFWGVPYTSMGDVNGEYINMVKQIPVDTDVLITHRPPLGILDNSKDIAYGCPHLLQSISAIRPRYHLFGHIHAAYGIEESEQTTFVNAALMDEESRLVNKGVVVEV